ncbi:Rare lipoprotein A [Planoprotostelium fungivorum]|uniref:Rare lipoprotein A n=1 Tax=Planoprotostelium fungivorum TaxID=1890364 RepID=A0A2P6MZ41_9EUKA|nr:Rare lipoprotein A [Planoprotostelium fungivorum]
MDTGMMDGKDENGSPSQAHRRSKVEILRGHSTEPVLSLSSAELDWTHTRPVHLRISFIKTQQAGLSFMWLIVVNLFTFGSGWGDCAGGDRRDEPLWCLRIRDVNRTSIITNWTKPIGTMKIALVVFLLTVSIAVIQAAECSNAGLPNNLLQYQADLWDLRAKVCNNGCNGTCTLWGNERTVDSGKYKARAIVKSVGGSCWGAQQNVIEQCVRNNWIGGSWSWGNEYYSLSFVKTGETPSPQNNGVVTYYNCESGQQGACGGWIKNSDAEAAVGDSMFKNGAACGKKVRLSGPRGSIDVTIRDSCGWACEYGHFDICQGVFGKIADPNDGLVKIKWSWL